MLNNAIKTKRFQIFSGKYCLGDAEYSNSDYLLVPYKRVWYHLNKQKLISEKLANTNELFNLHHACLLNIIEQIFGIVKCRFQILDRALEYSQTTQVYIVNAIIELNNFIKIHSGYKKDIYNAHFDISDNIEGDSKGGTEQSDFT